MFLFSGINEDEYEDYKSWLAYSIPRSVPANSNVAVIQFATSQTLEFNFYEYTTIAEWENKISQMEHLGGATWTSKKILAKKKSCESIPGLILHFKNLSHTPKDSPILKGRIFEFF